ncbi:MAG: type I-C CRISPR-associated protein Cas8c/Csd1 [Clostridiales bacterium]
MILQSLYEYYYRALSQLIPMGYESKAIQFILLIDKNGKLLNLENTESNYGGIKEVKEFIVPRAISRTSETIPNLFWDNKEYILENNNKNLSLRNMLEKGIPDWLREDMGIKAIIKFYDGNGIDVIRNSRYWDEIEKSKNSYFTFKLVGEVEPIPCSPNVKKYVSELINSSNELNEYKYGICSITGKNEKIARIHADTFINKDAKKLVCFQKEQGYDSYKKTQAFNSSIGISAEFAYTTALKHLLRRDSANKFFLISNKYTTIVFWAEKQNIFEENFSSFFIEKKLEDNPEKNIQIVRSTLEAVYSGRLSRNDCNTRFYILGLCQGGGTRIAVRFWKVGTVKQISDSISTHYNDLEIITNKAIEGKYLPLKVILKSIVRNGDLNSIDPYIEGEVIESIIDQNKVYPIRLQEQSLRRIIIGKESKNFYIQIAILKACVNRKNRIHNKDTKEIAMSLDLTNTNQGYLCGRLFSVLEKIQMEAQPGINSTIKDRYFGAASSTPGVVFGRLLNLTNYHLGKLRIGRRINMEKLLQGIIENISSTGMPINLSLDDQSRFAIGYYHQRQDLFTKKIKQ